MAVVSMSEQEFSRLEVLLRIRSGGLRVADGCVLIGLRRRQVFRLLRGLKQDGATSLLSKHRGKPSNHRLPAEVRTLPLSLVRERYADFGPTIRCSPGASYLAARWRSCARKASRCRPVSSRSGRWRGMDRRAWPGLRKMVVARPHQPRAARHAIVASATSSLSHVELYTAKSTIT